MTEDQNYELDPNEAIEEEDYEDPSPTEVTDPNCLDFCEPAPGINPLGDN